jgi:hypothetical protein
MLLTALGKKSDAGIISVTQLWKQSFKQVIENENGFLVHVIFIHQIILFVHKIKITDPNIINSI